MLVRALGMRKIETSGELGQGWPVPGTVWWKAKEAKQAWKMIVKEILYFDVFNLCIFWARCITIITHTLCILVVPSKSATARCVVEEDVSGPPVYRVRVGGAFRNCSLAKDKGTAGKWERISPLEFPQMWSSPKPISFNLGVSIIITAYYLNFKHPFTKMRNWSFVHD